MFFSYLRSRKDNGMTTFNTSEIKEIIPPDYNGGLYRVYIKRGRVHELKRPDYLRLLVMLSDENKKVRIRR